MDVNDFIEKLKGIVASGRHAELINCSIQDVVSTIYGGDFSASGNTINQLIYDISCLLPSKSHDIATICDMVTDNKLKILSLRAGLLAAQDESVWIHYRICILLSSFKEIGIRNIDFPLLTHCFLVVARLEAAPAAGPFVLKTAASLLQDITSYNSARLALGAIDCGNRDAFWTLKYLSSRERVEGSDEASPIGLSNLPPLSIMQYYRKKFGYSSFDQISIDEPYAFRAGSLATFTPPINGSKHFIFRESQRQRNRPNISCYVFKKASISFRVSSSHPLEFYIYTEDGQLVENLSFGYRPFRAEKKVHRTGSAALVSDQFSQQFNICHFLLDHLTRTAIYESLFGKIDNYIFAQNNDYIRSALEIAGIWDRALMLDGNEIEISADEIVISSNIINDWCHPAHYGDASLLETFSTWPEIVRQMNVDSQVTEHWPRIFVSRDDAASRKIINQPEVDDLLQKHGFKKITLGQFSIYDQIKIFDNASVVVGVHGAGLTNAVFGRSNLRLIEILPPMVATDAYWILAQSKGQVYNAVIGIDPEFGVPDYSNWSHKPSLNDRNLIVNVAELEAAILSSGVE